MCLNPLETEDRNQLQMGDKFKKNLNNWVEKHKSRCYLHSIMLCSVYKNAQQAQL